MRDNAINKKSDEKQSDKVREPIRKSRVRKTPEAGADKPSPAHRSGNPINRAYNGRGLILDSRK